MKLPLSYPPIRKSSKSGLARSCSEQARELIRLRAEVAALPAASKPVSTVDAGVCGTLQPVLDELKVPLLVGHGYNSATVVHDLAEMTQGYDRPLQIIYVGDRDPSDMHMSDIDLPKRLTRYKAKR